MMSSQFAHIVGLVSFLVLAVSVAGVLLPTRGRSNHIMPMIVSGGFFYLYVAYTFFNLPVNIQTYRALVILAIASTGSYVATDVIIALYRRRMK